MSVDLEFYILNTPPPSERNKKTKKQTNKQTNKQHLEDLNLKE